MHTDVLWNHDFIPCEIPSFISYENIYGGFWIIEVLSYSFTF